MQQPATDPTLSAMDMDNILTGISAINWTKLEQIAASLMAILDGKCQAAGTLTGEAAFSSGNGCCCPEVTI